MTVVKNNINRLHSPAQFALFVSSYLPLFILIIARQVSENFSFLHWGGFTKNSIYTFATNFGLSSVLFFVALIGWFGFKKTLSNIEEVAKMAFRLLLRM